MRFSEELVGSRANNEAEMLQPWGLGSRKDPRLQAPRGPQPRPSWHLCDGTWARSYGRFTLLLGYLPQTCQDAPSSQRSSEDLRPGKQPQKELLLSQNTTLARAVQFSCSVVSDFLRPQGLQHTRPSCPSPTPRVYSNSCPSSQWCHPTISSSVVPFSSRLQSFPASVFFQGVSSSHQEAKVLEFQLQHQSFQWIFRTDLL